MILSFENFRVPSRFDSFIYEVSHFEAEQAVNFVYGFQDFILVS